MITQVVHPLVEQFWQTLPVENVSPVQATQLVPDGCEPALQTVQSPLVLSQLTQLVQGSHIDALVVVEKVLAGQSVQTLAVVAFAYCPIVQFCWKEV